MVAKGELQLESQLDSKESLDIEILKDFGDTESHVLRYLDVSDLAQ